MEDPLISATKRTTHLLSPSSSCLRNSSWISTLLILLIYFIGNIQWVNTPSIDLETESDEYLSATSGSITYLSLPPVAKSSSSSSFIPTVVESVVSFSSSSSVFPTTLPFFQIPSSISLSYLYSLLFPSDETSSSKYGNLTITSTARYLQTSTAAYWKPLEWEPCSVPCGGGVQTRLVICWANLTQRETDASACPLSRPTRKRQCNKFLCPSVDVTEFSCDVNAIGGAIRCPQQFKGGGRLQIRIMQAYSLPSFETYTWSGKSDPYVVVKIGNIVRRTSFVMNNAKHPIWGDISKLQNAPAIAVEDPYAEDDPTPVVSSEGPLNSIAPEGELLFFGIQDTLTPITIELWDSDGGFEGYDDLLGTIYTNVIACSALSDFCDERTWLPLTIGDDCFFTYNGARNATMPDPSKTCLHIEQIITPFNLTFEQPLPEEIASTRIGPRPWAMNISIANTYQNDPSNIADMYREGGKLEADFPLFKPAQGGLIARSSMHDYLLGDNYSTGITVNYRCYVYLFRYTADGLFESAEPPWLRDPENGWALTTGDGKVASRPIGVYNPNGTYRAYVRFASAFSTFQIHGPTAGIVVLNNETWNMTNAIPVSKYMYFLVARPWTDDLPDEVTLPKPFDRAAFLEILPIFIIPELFFLFLIMPFCVSIQFRFDMIEPYLATRVLPRTRDGPKSKAGDTASGHVTVTRILLPTNPEHLIASALLDHPDVLRAENSRRRQLDTDVTAFLERTVISGVRDAPTPKSSSNGRSVSPTGKTLGTNTVNGSTNDLARKKSMAKTKSMKKSKSVTLKENDGNDNEDIGSGKDKKRSDDGRPRRRNGKERIKRAKSRLDADYDSEEELDRQMRINNPNYIGEDDEEEEESEEEEEVETIDTNNPNPLSPKPSVPESSSLFSDSEVKSTKKNVIKQRQNMVHVREMDFEQSSSFFQPHQNPEKPSLADSDPNHGLSSNHFSFLVHNDRIDVPHPIPVADSQTEFHRRLYWTAVLVRILLVVPFCINLAHGIVILSSLQPRAVGIAILLFGSLGYLAFWAIGQFVYGGFKPNAFILDTLLLFLVSSIIFLYIAVFTDPVPLDYHLASLTAVSATASFLPMVLLAFLNTEALSDAITSMQGLSKVLRQEEENDAERLRKEAKKKMEETGKIKSETSFEMKAAKKKAEEASISVTSALGIPPEVAPALGSVLGTAALVCYDYAIDPTKSAIPPELQEKMNGNDENEEKVAGGKAPKLRQSSFRNKNAKQLFEGDDEMEEENEEVPDPNNSKNKGDKMTPGVAGFMSKKGPEWESAYRKQLEAHLGHLAEEVIQREKALAEKLEQEKQAKEAEYREVIKQAAEAAAADSQRSRFEQSGISLGLSEQDDTILRLTSVASAPWLQPHGEGVTRPFSFRSPTHILGTLLGHRVFSLLGSAPTIELHKADGFNDIISLHPSIIRKLSRVCLVISFTLLLLHAIIVGIFFPLYWFDGIVTALSLAVQDWTAYCLITSFLLNRGPVYFTLLLATSRAVIVWYCGNTWLAGQAFAYGAWGIALGYEASIHRLPAISKIASEFICYMGLFQLGKEYATAVTATNEAAKTFQQDTARFFGVDLKRNYVAEEEAARRRRKARLKKGKAADDDDDDDDLDENADKDDPYSMERVKERELAKKQTEEKAKTPLASRYQARERSTAPATNPDGTPNENAVNYSIGRKDENKVVRTAAARLLQNTLQNTATSGNSKSKDKATAAADARAAALAEASKRAAVKANKGKKARSNQVVPVDGETGTENSGFDASEVDVGSSPDDGPTDTSVIAMAAYARRHRKVARSFLSEVLQLREAWAALLVLTALYVPVLLAGIGFYESRVAWANAQPKYEAGLFDSEVVYLVPSINFFGVLTKVWIVGIAALAAVTLTLFISATITAFQLRGKGLLPPSFDILLPIITRKNKELRRIPYPEFMVVVTELISIIYGLIFYFVSGSGTVLVLSVMVLPILALVGFIGNQFIENGYSLLQPGRFRPRMSVAYLLELNALAGYPLADKKYLNRWRNKISVEDGYLLHKLEFGPGGHGTSVFSHPVARGEGYTPGADITGVDLYGNGSSLPKENMDFINRSAKEDEARRKHTVQSSASLYGQNKANKNKKAVEETAAAATGASPKGDAQSQRMVALQQSMLKRGQGVCACFSRYYYRWKLKGLASQHMGFLSALFRGYLTVTDIKMLYATIGLFFLVFVTGIICAFLTTEPIIGHSMWYGLFIIFSSAPIVATYIQTAQWKLDMLVPIVFSFIATALGIGFMMVQLFLLQGPDERVVYSTACAGGYWGLLVGIIGYTQWSRNDYAFQRPTIFATVYFYISMAGVNFAVYGWGSFYTGAALSLVLLTIFITQFSVWIYHGFRGYVPASWRRFIYLVMTMITVGAVSIGISQEINLFYCFSVGFFFLLLRYGGRAIIRLLSLDDDSPLVCGPLIFPLFSYDIETGQPRNEDLVGTDIISSILIMFAWGIFAIMFVDPLFTGITMVCGTLIIAVIIAGRSSIHTPLAIGSFAPYIDTDAVRGARTIATNSFFSRRTLAPVEKMLNTAEGATVVDGFSNAMMSAAAYDKAQKDRQRILQAKKVVQNEKESTGNNGDSKDTVTVEDATTGEMIHIRTAHGGLAALSGEDVFGTLNRSLSFLDPSYRDATSTELASHAIARMNAGRDTCAKGLAQMACMQWCVDHAWPWQIPETMFNKELFISLLSRLQVSADEMMKKHDQIIASVHCECSCMNATSKAEEVDKRLQKEIRKYVIHAAAELAHARDVTDIEEISATLYDSEFMVQPLTDFTQAMINVIRKKSLLTKAQELKRLQEAQEWLEKNVMSVASPGASSNVTPSRPIPPMLGALRSSLNSSKKLVTPMGSSGKRRGFSASPSIRNLNAELNPSASAKAELNKLVASSNRGSTRSLNGSTNNLNTNNDTKDGTVPTTNVPNPVVRSASTGPSFKMRRGDTLRSLERVAKAASAFQIADQASSKNLTANGGTGTESGNTNSVGSDVKNAREARKKGGNTNAPTAPDESKPKGTPVAISEIVVGRRKRETCTEIIYRNIGNFFGYFIGTPPEAIPPPVQPTWQADIARGDALASDEFKRTKAKKSVVYYALTSYLAYMDTAQLASFLVHPMYNPVERPDRPWTWKEAIVDGFVLGDGPLGFVVMYGLLFDFFRAIFGFLNSWCGICGSSDSYEYSTRTRRSVKGWRKSKFPSRIYSHSHTVGCCGRRAPLYAREAIPSEYEIDRLVQKYTEYTGQPVRVVRPDNEFLQTENFPDLQADPSLTLSIDGTPVRTAPIDFHGLTQPSRNTLFGLITRAKGWLPDRLPETTLKNLFGSHVTKSKASTKRNAISPPRTSSKPEDNGVGDPANVSGTDSDTNVRNRNNPPVSNPSKPSFTVSNDEHVGLVVTVGPDGGRVLGIEEPLQRATAPASHTHVYAGIFEAQRTVGIEFYEETRALLHFQMLLASYGRARLQSHRSRYPYFVDVVTKTLKLAGASLPSDGKPLHADLVNTACWLSTLEDKYQGLYRRIKQTFDGSMRTFKHNQLQLYKALVASKIRRDGELENRAQAFVDAHTKVSKAIASTLQARISEDMQRKAKKQAAQIAMQLGEKYDPNDDTATAVGEIAKVESYSITETMIGRILVHEVEKLKKNCSQVAGGRMRPYTFVDPDFLPDNNASVGELNPPRLSEVLAPVWRLSPAFNKETRLFTSGSDPDDVIQGYMLKDGWLMSAIAMLAASGGLGDNSVDPLIDNIFITKRESETGVYALRLNIQGHWISILLDDAFPVLHDAFRGEWSRKTPKSRGAAIAHARDFGELWVPLIEKAIAKVYGGYGELNRGYIEHGLQLLTGAETQRLPLQVVVDGPFRARLWKEMNRNIKECGYLLGAETFSIAATLHSVDKSKTNTANAPLSADGTPMLDLLPNGLAPASVYIIYDIQQIGDYRLVKLREPPSVRSAWKGDFSAESDLWTSRLITQLNWSAIDDDENRTFWMSFDDFCNNFQSLYTCRVMDSDRWYRFTAAGVWNGPTAAGLLKELKDSGSGNIIHSTSLEEPNQNEKPETPEEGVHRTRKNARYGFSEIHLNPQFSLEISRATSLCITLQQAPIVDEFSGSSTIHDIHPVAIYIVNRANEDAARLDLAAYNAQVNARYLAAAGEIRHAQEGLHNHSGDISNFGTTFRIPSQKKGSEEDEENDDDFSDEDEEDDEKSRAPKEQNGNIGSASARSKHHTDTEYEDDEDDKPKQIIKGKKSKRNKKGHHVSKNVWTAAPREPTEAEIEIARAALGKETGSATSLWEEDIVAPFLPRSDGRVYALTASNIAASSGAPLSRDTIHLYAHLPAGRYVILPVTEYAGQEGMFGLIVEATSDVTLTQLWPPLVSKEEVDAHLSANEASSHGTLQGSTARAADAAIERHVDKLMQSYGYGEFMRKKHERDNSVSARFGQMVNLFFNDMSKYGKLAMAQTVNRIERGLGIGGDVQCYSQIKTLKTQEVQIHLNHAKLYNQAFDDALKLADNSPGGASTRIYETVGEYTESTDKFMGDYDLPLFRHWGEDIVHINEVVDTNELYATMANVQAVNAKVDLRSTDTKKGPVWAANKSSDRPSSRGGNPPIVEGTSQAAQGFDN